MVAFFIPGLAQAGRLTEETYGRIRAGVELDIGARPRERRILQLFSRRAGADCVTEVGRPDPVHGGTVLAIFDLGPHRPFVVHRQLPGGGQDGVHEVLSCHVYAVTEFDG